jgi:hypothetical protein
LDVTWQLLLVTHAGTVGVPGNLLASLAARLPAQAEMQQQQQQQQQQGQLPPDQQAELHNSLNTLGFTLLRVWAMGSNMSTSAFAQQQQQQQQSASAAAAADTLEPFDVTINFTYYMCCHTYAALYAELALHAWPPGSSTAAGTAASSSIAAGSSTDSVTYGKQVLPRLILVSAEAALPAALATAHTLVGCIDTLASYRAMNDQLM